MIVGMLFQAHEFLVFCPVKWMSKNMKTESSGSSIEPNYYWDFKALQLHVKEVWKNESSTLYKKAVSSALCGLLVTVGHTEQCSLGGWFLQ